MLACVATSAWAQSDSGSSFLRPEQSQPTACNTQLPSKIPIRCWVGQQFLVLPKDPTLRNLAYGEFYEVSDGGAVTYDELAGKTVTVTDVEWETRERWYAKSDWYEGKDKEWEHYSKVLGSAFWIITVKLDATGTLYKLLLKTPAEDSPDDVSVSDLALVRDLKAAREAYLGRTYWIMHTWLPQLGVNGAILPLVPVPFKQYMPVVVSDVLASDTAEHPVRIVVKNEAGQEGYFDIAMSPTNVKDTSDLLLGDTALAKVLASVDPKMAYKWPAKIWAAIEDGNVLLGMTAEQVRVSWHAPERIERTDKLGGSVQEKWIYDDHRYVDFKNGIAIEVRH